jgi:hypothetical protein
LPDNVFTEPLPSNDRRIHIKTRRLRGRIYEVSVEMGSVAMTYISSFIKIGSGIQKLIGGIHRHTDSKVIT